MRGSYHGVGAVMARRRKVKVDHSTVRRTRLTIAAIVHGTVAIITTWPLALDWRTHLPLGSERVATVPQFNLWTLRWNADRAADHYTGYWDAPIFAPLAGAFARSEAQPLTGLAFAALRPLGGNVGAYNLTLWAFLIANALAAHRLARRLGAHFGAALLVGVLAQTLPFTFNELGVLQLVPLFPIWLILGDLVAYRRQPTARHLIAAGCWFATLCLISGYYALFTVVLLVIVAPWFVIVRDRRWRCIVRHALLAAATVGLLAGAFVGSQQSQTADESWSSETVLALSAQPSAWIQHSSDAIDVPWAPVADRGQALFPGGILLGLAVAGVVGAPRQLRLIAFTALAGAVAMFALSLGLRWSMFGWSPYSALREHVAGFDRLRSPFRAAAIAQAAMVVLAASCVLRAWCRRCGRVAITLLVFLAALETVHWDQPSARVQDVREFDWVQWLADRPGGAVAMVPFPASGSVVDYEDTTTAMLAQFEHGHPLVNGYTGLFPDDYRELRFRMEVFPEDPAESMTALNRSVARYVVLRDDIEDHAAAEHALVDFGWTLVFDGADRDVWSRTDVPASD